MLGLTTGPLNVTSRLIRSPVSVPMVTFDLSMTNQHVCPCCSYVLLRHVHLGGLYWHCSHCHASMPAWSPL